MYKAFGEQTGFGTVFAVLTGVFAVVAVIVAVFGKETKGRSLEQISG